MKKKKVMVLDVDGLPLKKFVTFMVDRLVDLPCNAKVVIKDNVMCLEYYKNECKK